MRSTSHIAISDVESNDWATRGVIKEDVMGLVKTRRLAAMHKQQRAKAGMKLPAKKGACALPPHLYKSKLRG